MMPFFKKFPFALVLAALFLVACADYVEQIDDQIAEYEAHDKAMMESSSSVADRKTASTSSSVTPKSSSSEKTEPVSSSAMEDYFIDERDGRTYRIAVIDTQIWMAENLNYETDNSYCYDDDPENCAKYGRLYTWAAAMDSAGVFSLNAKRCGYLSNQCDPTDPVRGICPEGWHFPNKREWNALFSAAGGNNSVVKKLKATSGWDDEKNGSDDYGFSLLPAGFRYDDGRYLNEGGLAVFCTSDVSFGENAERVYFRYNDNRMIEDTYRKNYALSVRCVKN